MKTYINKSTLRALSLMMMGLIMSCENTEVSETVIDANQPVLTVTSSTGSFNFDGVENDQAITLTATLSKPTVNPVRLYLFQESGTVDSEDIGLPVSGYIEIPAYQTSASQSIVINKDDLVEDTETAVINIGDTRTTGAAYTPVQLKLTIENYVSDNLKMVFDWEKDIMVDGEAYSACDNVDIDIYIAPAQGFDIADPFVNAIEDYAAASASCPEEWTLTFDQYPDGDYVLFSDLSDNQFLDSGAVDVIPVTATFTRGGVFTQTIEQEPSQVFTTETVSGSMNGFLTKISIQNGIYTIKDYQGTQIVSRRAKDLQKVQRPQHQVIALALVQW